jgi:hypothetical protein
LRKNIQVAGQLGLHPDAVTDPFVERLLIFFLRGAFAVDRMRRVCARHGLSPLFMVQRPAELCITQTLPPEAYAGRTMSGRLGANLMAAHSLFNS